MSVPESSELPVTGQETHALPSPAPIHPSGIAALTTAPGELDTTIPGEEDTAMEAASVKSTQELKDEMVSSAESYISEDDNEAPTHKKARTADGDSSGSNRTAGGTKKPRSITGKQPTRKSTRTRASSKKFLYTSKYE
jgi:hypothetical protein